MSSPTQVAPTPLLPYTRPSEVPSDGYPDQTLGWLTEVLTEGDRYLQRQPNYSKISQTIKAIDGQYDRPLLGRLSSTEVNHLARIALVLVSGLTDIKPFFQYTTFNKKYEPTASLNNKLAEQWWTGRFIDQRNADAIRYAVAGGSSYLEPYWNESSGDLDARAWDPRDVFPIRPSDNISIQNAFGILARRERSVNYLKRHYPEKSSFIKPDRDGAVVSDQDDTSAGRLQRQVNAKISPFYAAMTEGKNPHEKLRIPVTDVFHCYVKDSATNTSSIPILKGDRNRNWSYVVPPGDPLYPRGRLIIFTRSCILWDGPNPFLHGLFPFAKLTLDPWPWTWLVKAPLWDVLPLQAALNRTLRVIGDRNERVAEPSVIADKNSMSKAAWNKLSSRVPGLKILQNALAGKGAQIVHEPPMDAYLAQHPDWLIDQMETLSGSKDLTSLMNLNQIPSSGTIEKITQSMAPASRMRSRVLEAYISEFAMMMLSNFMQFYDAETRVEILGPRGMTPEDFDLASGNPVPSHFPGDDTRNPPRPIGDRTTQFMRHFRFQIAPGSLLSSSSVESKLTMLQLSRSGLIDHWTLLEKMGVPNVGEPPQGADTITQRLEVERQMGLGMEVSPTGRKASGQALPRTVVKES